MILFWKTSSSCDDHVLLFKFSENLLFRREIPGVTVIPRPIEPLDHWNSSFYKFGMVRIELNLIYIYMFTSVLLPTYALCVHGYYVLI